MIWLTWRQFRAQAWTALAALAAIAITYAVTGPHLAHLYGSSGFATCQGNGQCATDASNFLSLWKDSKIDLALYVLGLGAVYVTPVLIGIFWGAPLVTRELEARTHRLVWNQSVTRTRWLAIKLGLVGLASMATAGLLSLMLTMWGSPINRAAAIAATRNGPVQPTRLAPLMFGAFGIAPVGYAAFAFALGVTAGVLVRRTIPAMAITLAVFAAVQIIMPAVVRPHLIPPVRASSALNPAAIEAMSIGGKGQTKVVAAVNLPGAWIVSNQTVTPAGHEFTGPAPQACENPHGSIQACNAAVGRLHLRVVVTYQPAGRYWAFQWYETAIFLAVALALAAFCFIWIRRRIA
jgi:hypothetical protein